MSHREAREPVQVTYETVAERLEALRRFVGRRFGVSLSVHVHDDEYEVAYFLGVLDRVEHPRHGGVDLFFGRGDGDRPRLCVPDPTEWTSVTRGTDGSLEAEWVADGVNGWGEDVRACAKFFLPEPGPRREP
jgi:hypothetical protein